MDTTIEVRGMDCPGCQRRLGTALERLEGVVRAEADHVGGAVAVRFDPERVGEDDIRQRIRAAGFDA